MSFSPLTTNIERTWQKSGRNGTKVTRIIIHHAATSSLNAIRSAFQGAREVSANYIIADEQVWGCVDEEDRPWTSASYLDAGAITTEIKNSEVGGAWPVSDATFRTVARWIADVARRYGIAINDDTVLTHQELYSRFGESYATACPGDLQRRKSELLALARSYSNAPTPNVTPKEEKVIPYYREDKTARNGGRTLKPGEAFYLNSEAGKATSSASNIVGGGGDYDFTIPVYADGAPGDIIEVQLLWQKPGAADPQKTSSWHYVKRMTFDRDGKIRDEMTCKNAVGGGYGVYARLESVSTNTNAVKVSVLDSRAFLTPKA